MEQLNIDFLLKPKIKLNQPVRLFEAFAGVGCQALAFKKQGIQYETIGISEIDKHAIASYNAIHGETKNYGNIMEMEIIPECDIFTWSFPCTDLSKAGKQKGLNGTRSGLVYEVLRLLQATEIKPKVLIMENVVDLIQVKFIREFNEIQHEIEKLGYTNYVQTLNAKDYGVAQNRDRVFMVSVLGDYYYEFPKPIELTKRLKDYLEEEVDEKYYLAEKAIKFFTQNSKAIEETTKIVEFGSYYTWEDNQGNINTQCNRAANEDNYALTVACAEPGKVYENNMRIRKLTPLECWRLMGINDEYFYKAQAVCSNSQLYKQAGNGIVVDVFAAILKNLF